MPPAGHDPLLLTPEQAARRLGMAVRTLWKRLAEGAVPRPVKVGSLTRWRARDLDAWVSSLPTAS